MLQRARRSLARIHNAPSHSTLRLVASNLATIQRIIYNQTKVILPFMNATDCESFATETCPIARCAQTNFLRSASEFFFKSLRYVLCIFFRFFDGAASQFKLPDGSQIE